MLLRHAFHGIVLLLIMFHFSETAKVLQFVPTLSYSHVAFNAKLADLLVTKNNNVTVLLVDVDSTVSARSIELAEVIRVSANMSDYLPKTLWQNPGPFEDASPLNPKIMLKLTRVAAILAQACKNLLTDTNLIYELKNRNYDVGVVEQYDMCGIGFLKLIGVKSIVWLSATAIYRMQPETIGVNYPLSYVPELFAPFSDRMNIFERTLNGGIAVVTETIHKLLPIAEENRLFKRLSGLKQYNLFAEASYSKFIVTNTLPFLDFAAPTAPNILSVAGITKWRYIASRGPFMVVTFGSIAKTQDMPRHMLRSLHNAFDVFTDLTFIVKMENISSDIMLYSSNVFYARWLPQIDLICHTNYRGIITHGGWSSVLESLSYGRPMILMPLFADHFKNAKVIEQKGLGLVIDKTKIASDTFTLSVEELVTNQRYTQNSAKFATMLRHASPAQIGDVVAHGIKRAAGGSTFPERHFRLRSANWPVWRNNYADLLFVLIPLVFVISY
uniref:glucuronosyltransferase n=1 Tax=Panagrellus redivivus TaxID=6233 RepID=A0A7E4W836_PANRE